MVGTAPAERAGAAAAVAETSSELGGALGIAILGSIGTAVYRRAMAGTELPALIPAAGRVVRDTLAGAVGAAERLPEHVGGESINAARDAFVHGFEVTAAVSAVIAAALAGLAGVVLRNVRTGTALDEPTREGDELAAGTSADTLMSITGE